MRHVMDAGTRYRKLRGVTLIELVVVVTIVGILTAIAYPNYVEYVKRGNRAEARSVLLEDAQILERNFTTANRYEFVNSDGSGGAPVVIAQSPKTGTAKYTIVPAWGAAPAQTFQLNATPAGVMVGDTCGILTLTNTGVKGAAGATTQAIVDQCWGK